MMDTGLGRIFLRNSLQILYMGDIYIYILYRVFGIQFQSCVHYYHDCLGSSLFDAAELVDFSPGLNYIYYIVVISFDATVSGYMGNLRLVNGSLVIDLRMFPWIVIQISFKVPVIFT